ncbi:unnamed protein product [Xylocopa violacea]|uniref:Uncharacterized protein n=1 Tax=Xylocopa violacea TaxID=135666 RepID=A0ABP1N9C9_XYLVO
MLDSHMQGATNINTTTFTNCISLLYLQWNILKYLHKKRRKKQELVDCTVKGGFLLIFVPLPYSIAHNATAVAMFRGRPRTETIRIRGNAKITEAHSKFRGSRMCSGSRANHLAAPERPSVSVVATLRVHDVIVFFEKCVGPSRTHASAFSREPAAITECASSRAWHRRRLENNGPVVEQHRTQR